MENWTSADVKTFFLSFFLTLPLIVGGKLDVRGREDLLRSENLVTLFYVILHFLFIY